MSSIYLFIKIKSIYNHKNVKLNNNEIINNNNNNKNTPHANLMLILFSHPGGLRIWKGILALIHLYGFGAL